MFDFISRLAGRTYDPSRKAAKPVAAPPAAPVVAAAPTPPPAEPEPVNPPPVDWAVFRDGHRVASGVGSPPAWFRAQLPPPPPTPPTIDVVPAADALRAATSAHARAAETLAEIQCEHTHAVADLERAQQAYAQAPYNDRGGPNHAATCDVRSARERLELVVIRRDDAAAAKWTAHEELDAATIVLEAVQAAVRLDDLRHAADLVHFRSRQAPRSFRMLEILAEMKTLAEQSDADYFATRDAAAAAGLEAPDELQLIADLIDPLPFDLDTISTMRHGVRVDEYGRTALVPAVEAFASKFAPPRGMAALYPESARADFEVLRQHRTFIAGRHAVEARRAEASRVEAERFAQSPEEIARRQAHTAEQARLEALGTTSGMYGPHASQFDGYARSSGRDFNYNGWKR